MIDCLLGWSSRLYCNKMKIRNGWSRDVQKFFVLQLYNRKQKEVMSAFSFSELLFVLLLVVMQLTGTKIELGNSVIAIIPVREFSQTLE